MRVLHQQHADLQKLLLSVGKQSGTAIALTAKPQQNQHLVNAVALLAAERGPQARPDGPVGFHGDFEVFPYGQRFKHGRLLELTANALTGDGRRFQGCQIDGLIVNSFPAFWPGFAGDHVHQRGFTGAVRANDAAQFSDADIQRKIGQRLKTVETDVNGLELQHRIGLLTVTIAR